MTLCSYVPWGRGSYPQATTARVKHGPSDHLVRSAFWKVPQYLALGKQVGERLKIKWYLIPIIQIVLCYYKASKLW